MTTLRQIPEALPPPSKDSSTGDDPHESTCDDPHESTGDDPREDSDLDGACSARNKVYTEDELTQTITTTFATAGLLPLGIKPCNASHGDFETLNVQSCTALNPS